MLADPARIDEEIPKSLDSLFFVVLGKGRPALTNSMTRLMVGCLYFLRSLCLI